MRNCANKEKIFTSSLFEGKQNIKSIEIKLLRRKEEPSVLIDNHLIPSISHSEGEQKLSHIIRYRAHTQLRINKDGRCKNRQLKQFKPQFIDRELKKKRKEKKSKTLKSNQK